MVEDRRRAHAVFDIQFHVVWIAKYRYKVLKGRVAVSPDHVHMLLSAPAKLVQYIKVRSLRKAGRFADGCSVDLAKRTFQIAASSPS